ncbi:MAG: PGF-pre-PGF domain-containing protein, partial [Bacteroidota bacterium]
TYPDGTLINYPMKPGAAGKFYYDLSDTEQYGRFNISIQANDTTGNTNSTQKTQFFTTFVTNKENVVLQENNSTNINAPLSNTSLLMFANHTSVGSIKIVRSLINMTSQELNIRNPGIYVLVNTSNSIKINLSYFVISVNYTDDEVSPFVENSLRLLKWNTTSSTWEKPDSVVSIGNDAGVDTVNNFIWANVATPGEFAVTGDVYVPSNIAKSPGSSTGGGGGGGGGISGEEYSNIELKEKHDKDIFKDKVTSYAFSSKNNPILFVNITGNVNAGEITTVVEVLKNTSTLLKIPAPGTVFKNINFLVGTSGFSSSNKLKEATIGFRVYNSWLLNNDLLGSDIKMVRWNGSSWNALETHQTGKDNNYTYFESKTVAFSAFAITGMKRSIQEASPMRTWPETTSITNDSLNASKVSTETALPVNWVIIIIILVGIGIFLFLKKGNLR